MLPNILKRGSTARQLRAELKILPWTLAWVGAFLAADLAISRDVLRPGWPVIAAILAVTALGGGVVFAYRRYLTAADELRRKIELDALAIAFGVGLVGGFAASLLLDAEMIDGQDLVTGLVVGMTFAYVGAVLVGLRRYS